MNANIKANAVVIDYLEKPQTLHALRGGRRAGKTFNTIIWLLGRVLCYGDTVIVATMTDNAGTRGAYSDVKEVIKLWGVETLCNVLKTPKQVEATTRAVDGRFGVMYFSSYADSESAKGGACDWVFINEGNKFTYAQYLDLSANARKGVIVDYNPNEHFWIEDELAARGEEELVVTWKDNVNHLTPNQLSYFDTLKKNAERPDASAVDIYYYRVYYLGEYGELSGDIFTPYNIHFADVMPSGLCNFTIFGDASALRGADFFALVLSARDSVGNVYAVDTFSVNTGSREVITRQIIKWCREYDVKDIYIETNGIIGVDFFEFAQNSGLNVSSWYSRTNKFERIVANYQNLTTRLFVVDTPDNREFMKQVYTFGKRCEHDDNIDALNTSVNIQLWQ